MMALNLGVFGATGPTGQAIIKEALLRGHRVVALVRSPEKILQQNDNLTVVKADLFKPDELATHLTGCDAVLSAIGYHQGMSFFKPVTLYEDSMRSITQAMKQAGVSRVVCITSWFTVPSPDNHKFMEWVVRPLMIGNTLKSMATMENYLETECPGLNYTIVRPPVLFKERATASEVKAMEGKFVKGHGIFPQIPRNDLARFMLDTLSTDKWDRKAVAICI